MRARFRLKAPSRSLDWVQDAAIKRYLPSPSLGVQTRHAEVSLAALIAAMEGVWERWPLIAPQVPMLTAAVDVKGNQLRVEVEVMPGTPLEEFSSALQRDLGVPVTVTPGSRSDLDVRACVPTNCLNPMKAGILVTHQSTHGTENCTMGFHVVRSGDEQFLTAGHCGWHYGPAWWHGTFYLGTEQGTLYAASGKDAMRIQMPDSQVSDDVHMLSTNLGSARNPEEGEPICSYRGKSETTDCGTVTDAYVSWHDNLGGFLIFGASAGGIYVGEGDSGGPIIVDGVVSDVAVGLLNTASGKFARLGDVLAGLGVSLYTFP